MAQALEVDLRETVLSNSSFGPNEIHLIYDTIAADHGQFSSLKNSVFELSQREDRTPATSVRLGVCYYILGEFRSAIDTLSNSDGGALAQFYLGKSHTACGNYDTAISHFNAAQSAGYDKGACALGIAEAQRLSGDAEGSLATLDELSGAVEQTAEYLYQRGATVAVLGGSTEEVVALYERAVEANPKHAGGLFGLARENDRAGNDTEALQLYQRAVGCFPTYVGAILNLGVLYEDRNNFDQARACYRRILDEFPAHDRAHLYLRDASASTDMYYDEEATKRQERMAQVLNVPVSDFELSVRARNVLQKMGVQTLGDLTRTTEHELLASKNFGETSLTEIREMLATKGLSLGQFASERIEREVPVDTSSLSQEEQALMDMPIADLNLSVRARKCMVRLQISTVGELVRRTGDELLECKNFGVTSLNEVREKLTRYSLKLRGD